MFDATLVPVRRALLSVSDKTGLVDFAHGLDALGVALVSTGGTAAALREAGLPVTDVSTLTGFPEIMDGRVKTLHPKVHGGLLGRRGTDDAVMAEHGIAPIDLLVVNLYPFEATTARPDCTLDDAIENIDIGGPAMLRAAAKNHEHVAVVVDPTDYAEMLEALAHGGTSLSAAPPARGEGVRAHRALRRRHRELARRAARCRADRAVRADAPPFVRAASRRCATARIRTRAARSTSSSTYRPARSRARACSRARSCRTTTSPTPMPRSNASRRSARRRRASSSSTPIRAASRSAPISARPTSAPTPSIRSRRSAASSRSIARSTPRPPRAILERQFVEVVIAPDVEPRCARDAQRKAERARARVRRVGRAAVIAMDFKRIAGGLLVQDADRDTLLMTDLKVVSQARAGCGRAARPAVRLARRDVRQVERDRLRARRPHDRHRRRPDEPRRSARRSPR